MTEVNRELETLSLVASRTDNSIMIMDAEGNFEWVNRGFELVNGMSFEKYIKDRGRNIRQNSNNENINTILDDVLTTKKSKIYNGKFVNRDGKIRWFQTTISPVMDEKDNIVHLIAIDTDITHVKAAEDQIRKQKQEIEDQRDELKKLNASKDRFFSIIAHDLKNPFHSIIGFSSLLINNFNDIDDERKKMFLNLIKTSSTSAYTILDNLLSWVRSQTNQIKFEPTIVNLGELIIHNIELLGISALDKGIQIDENIPENISVLADYHMLDAVIRNILNNAIKFTPVNGNINITCKKNHDYVMISISDNGIGMDADTISNLYSINRFSNTKGTLGESGTGLGLVICREYLIRHGSELRIESSLNKGSTFSFKMPLAK